MTAAEDLRTAVAALTTPTKSKIMLEREFVKPGEPTTVEAVIPSLIDQLEEAAEQGAEGGGLRAVPGSRPPTGLDVLDVRVEIHSGVAHRRSALALRHLDDVAAGLAGLGEELIRRNAMVAESALHVTDDAVASLAYTVGRWQRIARQVLQVEYRARELRGLPCPNKACCEKWATPGGPHEPRCRDPLCRGCAQRQAALFSVLGKSGVVRAMECRVCRTVWWAGAVLDAVGAATKGWFAAGELGVKVRAVELDYNDAGALAVKGRTA